MVRRTDPNFAIAVFSGQTPKSEMKPNGSSRPRTAKSDSKSADSGRTGDGAEHRESNFPTVSIHMMCGFIDLIHRYIDISAIF